MRWYKVEDVVDHAQNLSGAYMSHPIGPGHAGVFTGWHDDVQYAKWFDEPGMSDLPSKGGWYR